MKRNRLLLLLALLMTAATGAWAQSTVNVYYNALNTLDGMTKIDTNGDGGNEMNGLWLLYDNLATYNYHRDNAADDWLVTTAIELTAGVTYTIALDAIKPAPEQSTYTETFEVKVGTAATAANLSAGTRVIKTTEVTTSWTNYYGTFTPTTSGNYYVGIHATSPAGQNMFSIRNLVVGVKYYSVNLNDGTLNPTTWKAKVGDATEFGKLPLENVAQGQTVTLQYNGQRRVRKVTATTDAKPVAWDGDLSKLTAQSTAEYATATDGMTIKGTLAEGVNVKVSIAAGATVTLDGVTISGDSYCIRCLGNATIVLKDGTTNTLTSTSELYPALWAGDAGTTLAIRALRACWTSRAERIVRA